jgi:hypothetical protein
VVGKKISAAYPAGPAAGPEAPPRPHPAFPPRRAFSRRCFPFASAAAAGHHARMMKSALFLTLLALAGCATIDPAQVDPKILGEFSNRGVSPATLLKVRNGLPLTVGQVAEASRQGVPGPGLVSYMQSTRKAYNLSNADIAQLRAAGTPAPVIDYMRRSYGFFTKGPKAVNQNHPYFSDERYNLEAPFAYEPPIADTFFNSAYEENLYSPFSSE